MPSRPSGHERIQKDLDELLGQMANLAKALLIRNGEFFPFGATIGKRGKFALITPIPEGDFPCAQDVVDAILAEVGSTGKSLRAFGIAAMAATATDADAVRIELEHEEGSSLVIALPYTRGDFGVFSYGTMEAHRADRRIWPLEAPTRSRSSKRTSPAKAKAQSAPKTPAKPRAASKTIPKTSAPTKAAPKTAPKPRGTTKAKPPREARPAEPGAGHGRVRSGRKTLQAQTV